MKPRGTLLFFLSVLSLLTAGALYFPENGIILGNSIHLRFFSRKDLMNGAGNKYANIKPLLKQQQYLSDSVLTTLAQSNDTRIQGKGRQRGQPPEKHHPHRIPG